MDVRFRLHNGNKYKVTTGRVWPNQQSGWNDRGSRGINSVAGKVYGGAADVKVCRRKQTLVRLTWSSLLGNSKNKRCRESGWPVGASSGSKISPQSEWRTWRKSANPQSRRRFWALGRRHRLSKIQACLWGNFSPLPPSPGDCTHPRKQERSRLAATGGWTALVRRLERAAACFKGECRVACQCVRAGVCVLSLFLFSMRFPFELTKFKEALVVFLLMTASCVIGPSLIRMEEAVWSWPVCRETLKSSF